MVDELPQKTDLKHRQHRKRRNNGRNDAAV